MTNFTEDEKRMFRAKALDYLETLRREQDIELRCTKNDGAVVWLAKAPGHVDYEVYGSSPEEALNAIYREIANFVDRIKEAES